MTGAAIERYAALLLEANRRTNLTGARDEHAIAAHISDALSITEHVGDPHVDVGSGGGLPGIPLALTLGVHVTLVEATAKKAAFLRDAVAALGLDATVVATRAEVAAHDPALRGRFASATARAVGSLPTVLELTVPFLRIGGVAILQRGTVDDDERIAAEDAARMLGAEPAGCTEIDGSKQVLLFRKVGETPQRFPRRSGVPAKRPLCAPARRTIPA